MTRVGDKVGDVAVPSLTRAQGKTALGVAGLVAALVAGVAVVFGRVRDVEVPRRGAWSSPPSVCVEAPADRVLVGEALGVLREHGIAPGRLLPEGTPCDLRPGLVVVSVDPSLDVPGLADIDADGDLDEVTNDGAGVVWGRTRVHQIETGGPIVEVDLRVHPRAQLTAHVHELLHAHGYGHPPAAPSGHVLHPTRAGLADWRGVP